VQQQPLVPLPPVWLTCHTHLQVCRALRPLRLGPRALVMAPRVPYQPSLSHQQDMLSEWLALSHNTPSMDDGSSASAARRPSICTHSRTHRRDSVEASTHMTERDNIRQSLASAGGVHTASISAPRTGLCLATRNALTPTTLIHPTYQVLTSAFMKARVTFFTRHLCFLFPVRP
jgi:hypothetical protein